MRQSAPIRILALILCTSALLAGCARLDYGPQVTSSGGAAAASPESQTMTPAPSSPEQAVQQQQAALTVNSFLDADVLQKLSAKDKAEASSAQYYALQFGRPGAPREWSGDSGASGEVTVGPFVRVNSLDCRDFTHKVSVSGQTYSRSGTSCREPNGDWSVETGV